MRNNTNKLIKEKTFKKCLLPLVIGMIANGSLAQDNNVSDDEQEMLNSIEEVEVIGIRRSLEKAVERKRFADQALDAINAEDIGKLPDENIAESLGRITGVSISRDDGEGQFVSIRGLSPELTKVTVNGQGLSSPGEGDSFNFNVLSPSMVSGIEVFKSPLASQDEGGIGGTVNLKTRRPLEIKESQTNLRLQGVYEELADEYDPRGNLSWNGKFLDDKLGVMIGASYQDRLARQDALEGRGWSVSEPVAGSKYFRQRSTLPNPDMEAFQFNEEIRSNLRTQQKTRIGGNIAIQFQPNEEWNVNLNALYSEMNIEQELRQHITQFRQGSVRFRDVQIENDAAKYLEATGVRLRNVSFNKDERYSTEGIDLSVEWLKDKWTLSTAVGYSDAKGGSDSPQMYVAFNNGGERVTYDATGPDGTEDPILTYASNALDPDQYGTANYRLKEIEYIEDRKFIQFDAVGDLDFHGIHTVEFGIKRVDSGKERIENQTAIHRSNSMETYTTASVQSEWKNKFHDDINGIVTDWPLVDFHTLENELLADPVASASWAINNLGTYDVDRETNAAYIQARFETEVAGFGLRGNFGVRAVDTKVSASGYARDPFDRTIFTLIESDKNYSDVLPSLNAVLALQEDLLLRFSASSVMARPSFKDSVPRFTLSTHSGEPGDIGRGTGGNPDLDPYRADQYDLSLEWYFTQGGLLSAAYFYKDVESFLFKSFYDTVINGLDYTISTKSNGDGATIEGVELSYQQNFIDLPAPWNNLGVVTNYTYTNSETEFENEATGNNLQLPGLSKDTVNFVVFYEGEQFGARIAYTYTSEKLETLFDLTDQDQWADDYTQIDATLSYQVNDAFKLDFQVLNLTNEMERDYSVFSDRTMSIYDDGRRFLFGASYRF